MKITRCRTNQWTGAANSDFLIKKVCSAAPSSQPFFFSSVRKLLLGIVNFTRAAFGCLALLLLITLNLSPEQSLPTGKATVSTDEFEGDDNLQTEADALLPLFDQMPPVPLYLKDEPVLKSGTEIERRVAYTYCKNLESPTIFVKKIFYRTANRTQIINILKHELTHAWLCRQHIDAGHDARFRRKFKQVGGWGN